MSQFDRGIRDIGPVTPVELPQDQEHTPEEERSEAREDPTWNLGGAGNGAGMGVLTPETAWNPGGAGNAAEEVDGPSDDREDRPA